MIKDYELNVLDECRIKPLLKQIQLSDIKPKFFLSSVYPARTSYETAQKHNKEVRRTIRNFYKRETLVSHGTNQDHQPLKRP